MTLDEYDDFCGSLPHTHKVVQWGGAHVWKVGTPEKNKLFAVGGWREKDLDFGVTFKTTDIGYEVLRDTPGCRPAPYLASRGMKWIQCNSFDGIDKAQLKDFLSLSHELASQNLTKKLQKELGLNQGEGA